MGILLGGLKERREAAGMTQQALAEAAGVSVSTIAKHEQGAINGIDGETLDAIATSLQCTRRDLFFASNSDTSELVTT
ncbi:helix-turn-helix domain-containing protein [Deinococcus hohokamensis]|uniref:Helix-turn-helix domain-containing protein n=1 Tax=Deinococcus hohokamensis TaxID=309883 RepID=A0ABV9I3K0_9DEIO